MRRVSSACCTTGRFSSAPSRSAARMISSSRIGLPSSVTATAPARCSAAKSVSVCAARAARGGSDRKYIHHGSALGMPQPCDPLGGVHHGRGVRHGANRSEPSGRGGGRAGGDGFFVALSGLAQVNVQIDKSRGNDQTARIEFFVGAAANLVRQSDLGNSPIAQKNVHGRIDLRRRVDHVAALDQQTGVSRLVVLGAQHSD